MTWNEAIDIYKTSDTSVVSQIYCKIRIENSTKYDETIFRICKISTDMAILEQLFVDTESPCIFVLNRRQGSIYEIISSKNLPKVKLILNPACVNETKYAARVFEREVRV